MNTEKDKIIHGYYCENCIHDNHKDWRLFCQNCSKSMEYYYNQPREVDNFIPIENKCLKWISSTDFTYQNQIDNQTFEMSMRCYKRTSDSMYYYVSLEVYNKRKQRATNENKKLVTGLNPHATITEARKAFHLLENNVLEAYNKHYNIIILVEWTDNKRRDIYYRYLSRYGYDYNTLFGSKVLMKKYEKGEMCNE